MKKKKLIAALLAAAMLTFPVSADGTESVASETAAEAESVTEEGLDGKTLGALLMLGAIVSAAWISTMIFRGRDKTKYL